MQSAFSNGVKPRAVATQPFFQSTRSFEVTFLKFVGAVSEIDNKVDFAQGTEPLEKIAGTIMSQDDVNGLITVMRNKSDLAMPVLKAVVDKIEAVITNWRSEDDLKAVQELKDGLHHVQRQCTSGIYLNNNDQPTLSYLGLYKLRNTTGAWQHGNDSFASALSSIFVNKILDNYITPTLERAAERKQRQPVNLNYTSPEV